VVSFIPQPLYLQHTMDRRLGGHQSQFGHSGKEIENPGPVGN